MLFSVGSGAAGSVVAARLSEIGASVLLLEAGGPAPPESVPPGLNEYLSGSEFEWKFLTEQDENIQQAFEPNVSGQNDYRNETDNIS